VFVGASNGESAQAAIDLINAIANPQLPKIGERFLGTIVKTTDFGAFVSLLPGRDGLVHISKLGRGKRINAVEDVLSLGQEIEVRVDEIDDKGKISLVPVGDAPEGDSNDAPAADAERTAAPAREERSNGRSSESSNGGSSRESAAPKGDVVEVSFEDSFDAELAGELGDLGPASERPVENTGGGRRNDGGRRRHR
jgi:polyribonucleotide nucleotidyltransferase